MNRLFRRTGMSLLAVLFLACSAERKAADYRVVPLPQEIALQDGKAFTLDKGVKIVYPEGDADMQRNAGFLAAYVREVTGIQLETAADKGESGCIRLALGLDSDNAEAYRLEVGAEGVTVTGASAAGAFYGIQTLRKSLPVGNDEAVALPAATVNDFPRFGYRGMMLDVGRHCFTVDSVKRYIDLLALHNINRFHWHLTEDQGWRIEIKKYPELTSIGSKRTQTVIGHNSGKYDGIPYGGFYTQEEAREIVAYARDRYITVIPEIDMPGHMLGALSAYPELGCTGGPYKVWEMWGVSEDVLCAGNDRTMEFIRDVLTEIMDIFPSEYIHIGGDECPKVRWKDCPKCKARMKELGLKSDGIHTREERLQSWFISEVEKFMNAHGRQIIGWDEILEGGLAPNATVMAWRGAGAAVKAAKMKHNAIMVPTSHFYFDYYQSEETESEPLAIGGYLPVERVYNFDLHDDMISEEEKKFILGVQANLWTEYVPTFRHAEYMVLPRMDALSEVQWTLPARKDYSDFLTRMPRMFRLYDAYGYNYARHLFSIEGEFQPDEKEKAVKVSLKTIDNADIYYTLDGSEPGTSSIRYTGSFLVRENAEVKAVAVRPSGNSKVFSERISLNKATSKPLTLLQPIKKEYSFGGKKTLVDGLHGNGNYKTGRWIAFYGNDLEAVIDLQQPTEISSVEIAACVEKGDWIFDARAFAVEVSDDGKAFRRVAGEEYPAMQETDRNGVFRHRLEFDTTSTRFVKVVAVSEKSIPEWHGGRGNLGFLFVDEIVVK